MVTRAALAFWLLAAIFGPGVAWAMLRESDHQRAVSGGEP